MSAPATKSVFDVTGMDCADCARSVERAVGALPGVRDAVVNFGTGTLTVEPEAAHDDPDRLAIAVGGAVDRAGYTAALRKDGLPGRSQVVPFWRNRKLAPAAIAAVLWVAGFALLHALDLEPASIAVFAGAIAIGGWPILRAAILSLRSRRLDMNALMTISVVGAALLGDWSEGALVVVLFSIGTALQALTFDRTRGAIRSLLDQSPEQARVVRDGIDMMVAAGELVPGDIVRVLPGERLPADGEVIAGASEVTLAAITGESLPVSRAEGEDVFAGSLNGSGALLIRVTKRSNESMLATIVHLVEEAQGSKAPSQQLVDRFAAIYTPLVVVVAGMIAVAALFVLNDTETWLYRALVLLVIACPCALVISTPVSIVSAIGAATKLGVLVKGGAALEDMARVKTIAFDKTGTLTVGRPTVQAVVPSDSRTEAEVLAIAAAVEAESEHPLARAIVARAMHDAVAVPESRGFRAMMGIGAEAEVSGRRYAIGGSRQLAAVTLDDASRSEFERLAEGFGANAQTALAVLDITTSPASLIGTIAVADQVRGNAWASVGALHDAGITSLVMLSGDRESVAKAVAGQTGIDEVRAGMLPSDKASVIAELRSRGPVAMIGDGVNDAPALARADVGVAMGIGGSDVALESADVVLMRDDLSTLAPVVALSHRTLAVIRQNVTISMLTKGLALLLGVFGFVSLWIAVLVDVGTSLLVTANGLRLARVTLANPEAAQVSVPDVACGCGGHHHEEEHAHAAD